MDDRKLVGNAADPKQVKRATQHEKHAIERDRADLQSLCDSVQGRRFLWGLLSDCGVFRLSIAHGQPDVTGFNEGRRSIGLKYLAAIQDLDPTLYHRMAKEAHDLAEAYRAPKSDRVTTAPDTKETDNGDGDTDDIF